MKKILSVLMCVLIMLSFATVAASAKSGVEAQALSAALQDDTLIDEGGIKVVEMFKHIFSLVDWSSFISILISTIASIFSMFGGSSAASLFA
jgi:hypothetical protein